MIPSGCCQNVCDSNGAPRAIAVWLAGYGANAGGTDYTRLNSALAHPEVPLAAGAPYILYAVQLTPSPAGDGSCYYHLQYGPCLNLLETAISSLEPAPPCDARVGLAARIFFDSVSGAPQIEVEVGAPDQGNPFGSGYSTFQGPVGGAIPLDCLSIGQPQPVSLPLTVNTISGAGAAATCQVAAVPPGRDCTVVIPRCADGGSTGSAPAGSGSPFTRLRQPGKSEKCFGACDCCVCNGYGKTPSFNVYFEGFYSGQDFNPCNTLNREYAGGNFIYNLPFTMNIGEGGCVYGFQTSIFDLYLRLTIGFDGDPSTKGVFASLDIGQNYDQAGNQFPAGPLYTFEADHLELQWLEADGGHWSGPGTFPCAKLGDPQNGPAGGMLLPLVTQFPEEEAPCDTDDMRAVQCWIGAQGPSKTNPNDCCCPDSPSTSGCHGRPNLYACFGSNDSACQKLQGVLAELLYDCVDWSNTITLDDGSTLAITLQFANNQWQLTFNCAGGAPSTVNFAALNGPAQTVANPGCCAGTLTASISTQPIACPGPLTSAADGCCGCAGGVSPPNNLLLTVTGAVGRPLPPDPGCAGRQGCADFACEVLNGAWVLDYAGLDPLPNCNGGCNPCSRCHYTFRTNWLNCDYVIPDGLNGPQPETTGISWGFDVWIDWQGNVQVILSNGTSLACWAPSAANSQAGAVASCPSFDLTVPISWGPNCTGDAAVQLQSL